MVRKIVRDLEKKGPTIVSLKDERASMELAKPKNALDCSTFGKKKKAITPGSKRGNSKKLKDVSSEKKEEKVFFLHIDPEENIKYWKMGELIRLASAGLVILLVLNFVNIYYKGLDLKNDVIAAAYTGYEDLLRAGDEAVQANFIAAEQTFAEAAENFDGALQDLSFLNSNQNYFLIRDKTVDSVNGLLDAAKNMSLAGQNFARGIENLQHLPTIFIRENNKQEYSPVSGEGVAGKKSLTEELKEDLAYIQTATQQINLARQNLQQVSPDVLPPTFREKFVLIKEKSDQIYDLLIKTQEKIPALLNMLGDRYPHRYLILLQNDTEARPTGGFIGSYIIADLNDGYITKLEFHDVYELDGQFHEDIEPPEDIAMVSDTWRMRDSNYSPDFVISAEKAAWFYAKEGGPSVDSVIAINQSFIADLLGLTGPLQISSLEAPLNKDNFQIILSYIIESKISGAEKPKEILKELIPAFQNKLFSGLPLDQVLMAIIKGFEDKKIMLYSRNEKVQKLFDEFGVSNRITQTAPGEDYLQVVATSIGGNKSDKFMNQEIKHYTLIQHDGTVMNEVSIKRKHTWDGKDLEEWRHILSAFGYNDLPTHIIDILGRGDNKAFMKVYVPTGSELIDVTGIGMEEVYTRTDEELNKTYFMFQMKVAALTSDRVTLTYTLPEKLSLHPADTYKFHAQNQPSYNASFLEKKVYFKPGLKAYRQYPASFKTAEDGSLFYASTLNEDLYLSALVGN